MDLEQAVGVVLQAILMAIWLSVLALSTRVYVRLNRRGFERFEDDSQRAMARMRRSFMAFGLCLMPCLAALVPAFGLIPLTSQLLVPAILTWLVLLVFGSLQFQLSLVPAKAALGLPVDNREPERTKRVLGSGTEPSDEPRRNV